MFTLETKNVIINLKGGVFMSYLTEKELCEKLKWSRGFLYKLRLAGMPHLKINNSIRYEEEKVKQWLEERNKAKSTN
jgi:predicted DNA-binding transcriptional regulator AlpA